MKTHRENIRHHPRWRKRGKREEEIQQLHPSVASVGGKEGRKEGRKGGRSGWERSIE